MNAWQHREKRLNKYLAKFQARLRVAERDTARIAGICDGKGGDRRAEWEEFLQFHTGFVFRFKEQLDDYARMRNETSCLQKNLEARRPRSSLEKQRIEKRIVALSGALSMHLEQVMMHLEECASAMHRYELALRAAEES